MLDREEARARERMGELERRLSQFTADVEREQRLSSDADVALTRLDAEDAALKDEIKAKVEMRSGADTRVAEAEATLAEAEKVFSELTTALAALTAQRNSLEANVRTHQGRVAKLDQEIANVEAEIAKLAQATVGLGDLTLLSEARETAQQFLAEAEATAHASEETHVAARAKLEASRAPLADADRRVQRLETEARTISKIVNGETKNLWPPIIDGVHVAKGYEKALGAALCDDLDAPVDPSAPLLWSQAGSGDGDPSLPSGVESLADHVEAPVELQRRLRQIGVVSREQGPNLAAQLKSGQRLVSPEGDLWRWDGFIAAAHAPTGARTPCRRRA
jgi:chromosome segregation protein